VTPARKNADRIEQTALMTWPAKRLADGSNSSKFVYAISAPGFTRGKIIIPGRTNRLLGDGAIGWGTPNDKPGPDDVTCEEPPRPPRSPVFCALKTSSIIRALKARNCHVEPEDLPTDIVRPDAPIFPF